MNLIQTDTTTDLSAETWLDGATPKSYAISEWLDDTYPEGDAAVVHTFECDHHSVGDQCVGGCAVVITEAAA